MGKWTSRSVCQLWEVALCVTGLVEGGDALIYVHMCFLFCRPLSPSLDFASSQPAASLPCCLVSSSLRNDEDHDAQPRFHPSISTLERLLFWSFSRGKEVQATEP